MTLTLDKLTEFLCDNGIPCQVEGDGSVVVRAVATLEDAEPGQVSFLSNPKYGPQLATTRASAVLVRPEIQVSRPMNLLRTPEPYAAVTAAIVRLHGYRRHPQWGLSEN